MDVGFRRCARMRLVQADDLGAGASVVRRNPPHAEWRAGEARASSARAFRKHGLRSESGLRFVDHNGDTVPEARRKAADQYERTARACSP
ncbi:hypothetical protein SDC9_87578 [bioreactor metagenome]|uniref:Uncharacterized protein n=1 Tax=bioreactor metagenome TaxID=1076179 RepID=A0A644ZJB4_9ZZZZ